MLTIVDLRVEYKKNPLGMDEKRPRFFYRLEGDSAGQSSRCIVVTAEDGTEVWNSGWVDDCSTIQIEYQGLLLKKFTRYHWKVRVKDEYGKLSAWSREKAFFETGFQDTPWSAKWISGLIPSDTLPARRFYRDFTPRAKVVKARCYATALGVYEARINGKKITEDCLTPGFPDFYHRTLYQAYDVTSLIKKGANRLSALLADGWYSGRITRHWSKGATTYGDVPVLMAELHLTYEDGTTEILVTDDSWYAIGATQAELNSIHISDIYAGETFRQEIHGDRWMLPGAPDDPNARPVKVHEESEFAHIDVEWQTGAPIRRIKELKPISITRRKNGNWIVDFGQNFAGRERIFLKDVPAGTCIILRHGEMLRKDGSLYTANLRAAAATTTYHCDFDCKNVVYEPTFTFYGFRYLEITGWPGELTEDCITGQVLSSDLEQTGHFSCSDKMLNQLYSNILWGQWSNFVDIPTDCPQRDERYGWTGDTQVFANVATYNAFAPEFYTKWIRDLNLSVFPNGSYPNIAPNPYKIKGKWALGSSGWGDAGLICPWTMFLKYADTRIMAQYFDNMCRWLDLQVRRAGGSLIVKNACYGDWLNIDAPTPEELISTAYLGGMNQLAANIAYLIGREEDGDYRVRLAQAIAQAYTKEFFTPDGELKVKTQTAALLSLHFDLIPSDFVPKTVEFLVKDIRENRNMHLSTGFLGTPLLLKVLTKYGHLDLAYDLLLQTTYPGWLYPVTQGATTMWERWNSYTHKDGFGNVSMNSFNHYAYGAVGEWFYETICGIQPVDCGADAAGFQIFRLAPQPGKRLKEASASVMTLHGEIKSSWKRRGNVFTWEFTVPCNTIAEVILPEDAEFSDADGMEDDSGIWMAQPGSYKVTFTL